MLQLCVEQSLAIVTSLLAIESRGIFGSQPIKGIGDWV